MDIKLYTLIVHSENFAGLLSQVTAVFTRQQLNIESLNVSASSIPGLHKYTITTYTDEETIAKVAKQIEKKIDVISANYFTDEQLFSYEVALYKLSMPEFLSDHAVLHIISQYNANLVEVNSVFSILVKSGTSEDITALYEELQKYKVVLQFVRSGRIAVTTSCYEKVSEFLEMREKQYSLAKTR
jgi:acetolactate synthase small subunit